jgi:hypothetical protein
MTLDTRISRSTYGFVFAPWMLVGLIGPWQVLVGLTLAGALFLTAARLLEEKESP